MDAELALAIQQGLASAAVSLNPEDAAMRAALEKSTQALGAIAQKKAQQKAEKQAKKSHLGGSIGGTLGSVAGATIGSVVPGVGTTIGASIGGSIGREAGISAAGGDPDWGTAGVDAGLNIAGSVAQQATVDAVTPKPAAAATPPAGQEAVSSVPLSNPTDPAVQREAAMVQQEEGMGSSLTPADVPVSVSNRFAEAAKKGGTPGLGREAGTALAEGLFPKSKVAAVAFGELGARAPGLLHDIAADLFTKTDSKVGYFDVYGLGPQDIAQVQAATDARKSDQARLGMERERLGLERQQMQQRAGESLADFELRKAELESASKDRAVAQQARVDAQREEAQYHKDYLNQQKQISSDEISSREKIASTKVEETPQDIKRAQLAFFSDYMKDMAQAIDPAERAEKTKQWQYVANQVWGEAAPRLDADPNGGNEFLVYNQKTGTFSQNGVEVPVPGGTEAIKRGEAKAQQAPATAPTPPKQAEPSPIDELIEERMRIMNRMSKITGSSR